jgi:hypothetical protein
MAPSRRPAGLGLEVHTGRAVVVLLAGTFETPEIVLRHQIDLADPWIRESMHPYHQSLRKSGSADEEAQRRGCEAARRTSVQVIRAFVDDIRGHHFEPSAATIVARSVADPGRTRGAHARAHAEERKLYREAVEAALRGRDVEVVTLVENTLRAVAAQRLGRGTRELAAALKAFSRNVGTPWRAPEKNATLAAWLALSRSERRTRGQTRSHRRRGRRDY